MKCCPLGNMSKIKKSCEMETPLQPWRKEMKCSSLFQAGRFSISRTYKPNGELLKDVGHLHHTGRIIRNCRTGLGRCISWKGQVRAWETLAYSMTTSEMPLKRGIGFPSWACAAQRLAGGQFLKGLRNVLLERVLWRGLGTTGQTKHLSLP